MKEHLQMDGDPISRMQLDLQQLKRSLYRFQLAVIGLAVVLMLLLVALITVGSLHGNRIHRLDQHEGLIARPNVTFASQSGNRTLDGLTYGGSLFRGSGFWAPKAILPYSLTDHAAIGLDAEEVIYIIGGATVDGNATNQVLKFDAIFQNYSVMAPMPQPRYRFGAALLDNKIYVVGGRNTSVDGDAALVKSTFIYDIASNHWSIGPEQNDYHGDTCATSLYGKVYMIGGYGFNYVQLNTTEVYDPMQKTWSRIPSMPTPRGDLMCTTLDGEVYVLGGYFDPTNTNMNAFSSKMESFNPNTSIWTTRPDLLTPRGDAVVVILPGDKMMLVGGEGHYLDDSALKYPKHVNEVYYAADQTWVQKAMIPDARFRFAAATAGGLAFVFGGADVCLDRLVCPATNSTSVFLDVDHPHVYIYLKNEAYNDNAALTTYPL
ncbi:hypothetical protein O6H91_03G014900 [Diphasiastrum complanatum]|uniref:Uncharacterized protein n=1 Tax=Diphasiastrum complanatum TaxID=34168 RepID=A0ACC2E3Y8_DIPCM|nr:hypothetical protein O6H91_03G014900 [Diphasiastrum complanatum]